MTDKPMLYGFDGSTFIRTVRMVLADKGVAYDQVPVNVLTGETHQPEHLARHPFGKVPVLDIDGMRLRETIAICSYLEDKYPSPSLVPTDIKERALMIEAIGILNSYAYAGLIGAVLYEMFPDVVGGADEAARATCVSNGEKALKLIMENRGAGPWLAGGKCSLADYFLAPVIAYSAMTSEADRILSVPGARDWWAGMQEVASFKATAPVFD